MDLIPELLNWMVVWTIEFGCLAFVIIMNHSKNKPREPLNRVKVGLVVIVVGTVLYLNTSTLLFLIDDIEGVCNEIEKNTNSILNCVNEKQRNVKWEMFLVGFFATIAILIGTVMATTTTRNNAR